MQLSWSQMLYHRLTGWRYYKYPIPEPLPPKPWHPDEDDFFTKPPRERHGNSDAFIAHLEATGGFQVSTGSTKPNLDGMVNGYPLNRAWPSDRVYEISREAGPGKLWVHTGYKAPYGALFRYRPTMMVQGNPMQMYSDHKLHVYDEHGFDADSYTGEYQPTYGVADTVTEVQGFIDFGNGYLRCDGVKQYPLSDASWDARGSSAAKMPLAELTLRYDDVVARGWVQRASMGVVAGSTQYLFPALGSDGNSTAPGAPPFGVILRLKEEARKRLAAEGYGRGTNPQANAVMDCWSDKGIMIVDTGGNNATTLEPDPRWNQADLAALKQIKVTDFECWTL